MGYVRLPQVLVLKGWTFGISIVCYYEKRIQFVSIVYFICIC